MGRIAYAPCNGPKCKIPCYDCRKTRNTMFLVCKLWRQAVLGSAMTLGCSFKDLHLLSVPAGMNAAQIHTLLIDLSDYELEERQLPVLSEFPNLHRLEIAFKDYQPHAPHFVPHEIVGIQSLRELLLEFPVVESLGTISAATQLTMLHLDGLRMSYPNCACLGELSGLTGLRDLLIDNILLKNDRNDSDGEEDDAQMKANQELRHLSSLVNLTSLSFTELHDPLALKVITDNFTALEVLRFDSSYFASSFFPGLKIRRDLNPLSACIKLRHLAWRQTDVTDISALASLKNLETLDFNESRLLTTESLRTLSRLSTLKMLNLTRCHSLTCLTSLTSLTLSSPSLSIVESVDRRV